MANRIDSPDTAADIKLRQCLDKIPRVSFNMVAGAGSGKTTSLVKALDHIITTQGELLRKRGQQAACITYTEIAAKEIWNDVRSNPLVHVSTIHSFFWTVIRPFQNDIRGWVIKRINEKCAELQQKLANPRTRTREKIEKELVKLHSQAEVIKDVPYFNYGIGSNYSKGILGHDDIIKLVTSSITEHKMLGTIISQKYPYIFIDESQDTFINIVSAFKEIDNNHSEKFCLGFFGDPMQKIFPTGIGEIPIEANWESITKQENFRCSQQVLKVINAIRKPADGLEQTRGRTEDVDGKSLPINGSAQIFILPLNSEEERTINLQRVREWCSKKFSSELWLSDNEVKVFVIVHRMAAKRLKFPNLYSAMNDDAPISFGEGFLDGTAWPLKPFLNFVLPIVDYQISNLDFEVMTILRIQSPKLSNVSVRGIELRGLLAKLKEGLDKLTEMMISEDSTATVLDVLKLISEYDLAVLDQRILDHINNAVLLPEEEEENLNITTEINAMKKYFECAVKELWGYRKYFENESPFATQQGIKGAQFDKVITIMDDDEGTHIQFSYDKYIGVSPLSERDNNNIAEGKDNVISRTRRLFYVSCSRAKKDLVAIYYTNDVEKAKERLKEMEIFLPENMYTLEDFEIDNVN
ncbi:UvrD-helicase domain-containing protein [Chryseobacterium sp. Alg-005]|uniref:UvrD-helicase domain-containing protein n=1 Tax=Chryseobacterium sp. Alg-005 TaxID=3159516 RepID=UPI0035559025